MKVGRYNERGLYETTEVESVDVRAREVETPADFHFVPTHPLEGPPFAVDRGFPERETPADEETPDVSCVRREGESGKHGRYFESGAYRDDDAGKNDYEGFLSPIVLQAFGDYMTRHRVQSDGEIRDSDNWQRGIPRDQYLKSALRHLMDLWLEHRGYQSRDGIDEALGGLLFNVMGYWHELIQESGPR